MSRAYEEPTGRTWIPVALLVVILLGVSSCANDRGESTTGDAAGVALGDAEHGRELFVGYGCGACHRMEGVASADGRVGPDLDGLADQRIIAGVLANTPGFLAAWIQDPQAYSADTGMPDVGVTEQDAVDIAAFLLEPDRG